MANNCISSPTIWSRANKATAQTQRWLSAWQTDITLYTYICTYACVCVYLNEWLSNYLRWLTPTLLLLLVFYRWRAIGKTCSNIGATLNVDDDIIHMFVWIFICLRLFRCYRFAGAATLQLATYDRTSIYVSLYFWSVKWSCQIFLWYAYVKIKMLISIRLWSLALPLAATRAALRGGSAAAA